MSTALRGFRAWVAVGYLVVAYVVVSSVAVDPLVGFCMATFGGLCWELGRFARKRVQRVTLVASLDERAVAEMVRKDLDARARKAAFN